MPITCSNATTCSAYCVAAFKISKGFSVNSLSSTAPTTAKTFLYSYCCKSAGAAAAAALAIWPALPVLANHWFYALCLSLSLGAIWDFWCLVVALWFGVEVAPSFDKPWLSTSFADYWSRRWNLTTTYMLRWGKAWGLAMQACITLAVLVPMQFQCCHLSIVGHDVIHKAGLSSSLS